jgi:hypothetical protein
MSFLLATYLGVVVPQIVILAKCLLRATILILVFADYKKTPDQEAGRVGLEGGGAEGNNSAYCKWCMEL